MADWQSFATGFLESVGEGIDRKTEKAEEYETRQRLLGERNRPTVEKEKQIYQRAQGIAAQLRGVGVSEAAMRAALKSDPVTGIFNLQKNVQNAVQATQSAYGRNPTSDELAGMMNYTADNAEVTNANPAAVNKLLTDFYGVQRPPEMPAEPSDTGVSGFVRGLFGPTTQSVDERLRTESAGDGLSVYDLATYSSVRPYDPTTAGTFFSFQAPKFFNPDDYGSELNELRRYMTKAETSFMADDSYTEAVKKIGLHEDAVRNSQVSIVPPEELKEARALVENKRREALDLYVGTKAKFFEAGSYVDVMSSVINNYVQGYSTSFLQRADAERQAVDAVTQAVDAEPTAAAATESARTPISGAEIEELVTGAGGEITQDGNTYRFALDEVEGGKTFIVSVDEEGKVESFEVEGEAGNRRTGMEASDAFQRFAERNLNQELREDLAGPAYVDPDAIKVLPLAAPVLTMTPEEITAALESGDIKPGLISENVVRKLSPEQRSALGYPGSEGALRITEAVRADGGAPSEEQIKERTQQLLFKEDAKNNPDKLYVIRMPGGPKRRGFRESRVIKGSILAQIPDEALISGATNRNMISEYTGTPMEEYGDPMSVGKRDPYFEEEELLKFFKVRTNNEQE